MMECFPQQAEIKITNWAKSQSTIRAVIEVGSQVREDHPADEWSDIDLVLLITKPVQHNETSEWLREISFIIGDIWSIAQESNSKTEWFSLGSLISGRYKVDIVCSVIPENAILFPDLETIILKLPYSYVFYPSCTILYDLQGIPRNIRIASGKYVPKIPDEAELVNNFRFLWMDLVHLAQLFRRGEHWRAASLQSHCMEKFLLKLIEWHSLIFQNEEKIWPRGQFLEEWADPRIVLELKDLSFVFNEYTFWESIFKLYDLHRWVALEICTKIGFSFPFDEANLYRSWLEDLSSNPDRTKFATFHDS